MARDSYRSLVPSLAFAGASLLAACSGGGSAPDALQTPQSAAPAQAPQSAQNVPAAATTSAPDVAAIVVGIVGTPEIGTPGTYALKIEARTASGAAIKGAYAAPITLSNSDTSGATRLSVSSVSNSVTAVSLAYTGLGGSSLGGFDGATITATSGIASSEVAFLAGSACTTFKSIGGYYPCDLQSAYSLPSSIAGAHQTVAVVDAYDDPSAETDLETYRAQFGLPACTTENHCFRKVNQRGRQNDPPEKDTTGWSIEESLDLDMVSAICPNCHILFVEVDSSTYRSLSAGVDEAAALGATQISNSYGGPEFKAEPSFDVHYDHPAAMVVASSGDRDYGVEYPASSQYVTAVGGTNLTVASDYRGWNEFVWNNANVQGAGSGCSAYEPKPAWQKDTGCPNRTVADVAAVADPYTGVGIYDTYLVYGQTYGGWQVVGGTSVASPIIASIYALGGANPATLEYASYGYRHTHDLNDITSGANGTCPLATPYFCAAEVGYDGPTGNGTPIGTGAFGGPAVAAEARADRSHEVRRMVLQPAASERVVHACPDPAPGHFACDAIVVSHT
jgi:subtilase family serine protease